MFKLRVKFFYSLFFWQMGWKTTLDVCNVLDVFDTLWQCTSIALRFYWFLECNFFGGVWNPGTVGRVAVCCIDEHDLPTASLQLELKKSPPVTYKCVNHRLCQEFQVIALFPACFHCLFLSGSRAAKHIHAKSPWRFPSIMIVPYSTFISTNYDVRKCLYIFSYVQNRWYVWLKTHGLYFTQAL